MSRFAKIAAVFLLAALIFLPCHEALAADSSTSTSATVLAPIKSQVLDVNKSLASETEINPVSEQTSDINYVLGRNCPTSAEILSGYLSLCWSCTLMEKVLDAVNELSFAIWEASRMEFFWLAFVLFIIWLGYRLIGHVGSIMPESPEEFWTKVGHVLFKLIFVTVILNFSMIGDFIGKWIISPVIIGASEFTSTVTQSFAAASNGFTEEQGEDNMIRIAGFGASHTIYNDEGEPVPMPPPLTREEIEALKIELKELKGFDCSGVSSFAAGAALSNPAAAVPATGLASYCRLVNDGKNEQNAERIAEIERTLALSTLGHNLQASAYFNDCTRQLGQMAEEITAKAEETGNMAALHGAITPKSKASFMCMIESLSQEIGFGLALGEALTCYGKTAFVLKVPLFGSYALPDIPVMIAGAMLWVCCFLLLLIFAFKLIDACLRLGVLCSVMPMLLVAFIFPSTSIFAKNGVKVLVHVAVVFLIMGIILALAILLIMQAFQVGHTEVLPDETYDIRTLFYLNRIDMIHEQLNLSSRSFLAAAACFIFALLITNTTDGLAAQFSGVTDSLAESTGVGNLVGDSLTQIASTGSMNLAKSATSGMKSAIATKLSKK